MIGISLFEDEETSERQHKSLGGHSRCESTYESPVLTVLLSNILRRSQGGMSACLALRTTRL